MLKGRLHQNVIFDYFYQIVVALDSAHGKNVCNWDIKPHNIVVDSYHSARLIDFGVSKQLSKGDFEKTTTGVKGTLQYRAPELTWKIGDFSYLNLFATDIWSLGVTFY